MENISGNMEKNVTIPAAPGSKRSRSWQVLFVGGSGKIVTVTCFKAAVVSLSALLLVVIAAAVVAGILLQQGLTENAVLRRQVAELHHRNSVLAEEMEILNARLMAAGSASKVKEAAGAGRGGEGSASGNSSAPVPSVTPAAPDDPAPAPGPPVATESGTAGKIEVRDFRVSHGRGSGALRLRFVIHSLQQSSQATSGTCFVLLKGDNPDPAHWRAIPEVPLVEGRPQTPEKGQFFRIWRYKTVTFAVKNQPSPEEFTTAVILIYDPNGALMHAAEFPLSFPVGRRP
ncbi:MAG: hypothetical protein ACOZF0_23955 [Thermodesulfobacteriota bacterium]